VTLDETAVMLDEKSTELLALDEALKGLAERDPLKGQIVELRYFGGLTIEEIAEVLNVAPVTIKRHWKAAKGWLYHELKQNDSNGN
jgi:RNA polymerase sigma factor (sigma-70 family)